jgi:hypothetical protein
MGLVFEELNEPVEVLAHFDGKKARPLRFRWRGRVYRVVRLNGSWSESKGADREHHFAVTADNSDSFELAFDARDFRWRLIRVVLGE